MTARLLLTAALAIVAHGIWAGRSFPHRIAALAGRTSRRRMIVAWAAGLWVTYGLSAVVALILLGRTEAIVTLPPELAAVARTFGLPGTADAATLAELAAAAMLGALIGVAILAWRGYPAPGPVRRSPAAVQAPGEWPAAAALSLAAGIGEELFFRLLLPLLIAIVTGSGIAGVATGFAAFVALHRHQGPAGMAGVVLVGAALTILYLFTGALWLAILLHGVIDLVALVVRPLLDARLR